jgi:hypothetical protein
VPCKRIRQRDSERCCQMSQKLEQIIALVTYGNLYLQGRGMDFDIDKLVTHNCYGLDFLDPPIEGIAGSTKILASDANKWFIYLKGQNTRKLKLHYQSTSQIDLPDPISAAFLGGGSHWLVEVQFDSSSDLYLSEWVPSEDIKLDTRKIHYVRLERDVTHLRDSTLSVGKSREKLRDVLQELSEFAGKFDHSKHWAVNFNNALSALETFEPSASDEFLPAGIYSKEARQLIEGAFASWVFGGMGSWNDMSFDGDNQDRYQLLSGDLYSTLCNVIVSGINSYP